MSSTQPNDLWLVRHGETEWSLTRRHTGLSDIPLTAHGERQAATVEPRLREIDFALVLSSPLQRARRTAELAGFGDRLQLDDDLVELDYGEYEGITTAEIREQRPGWDLWRDGCPGGETVAQAAVRCARAIERARAADGPVLIVAHAHLLRTLAAVALELGPDAGRHLLVDPTSISVIGNERGTPAIRLWNDLGHLPKG
jgi:probable phosphoglycerate mutase